MSQALSLSIRPVNPLREGLNALFRLKRTIAALCVLLPAAAIGLGFLMTPKYDAAASVMVKTGREYSITSGPGDGMTIPPAVTKQEIINSEVEILQSQKLASATIDAVGLPTIFPEIADSDETSERKTFLALKDFGASLAVKPVKLSNVLDLSFRSADRQLSEQVLSTLLRLYLAQHVTLFSDPRSAGLDAAMQQYTDQLRDLEKQRTAILVNYDLSAAEQQRVATIAQQSAVEERLHTLRDRALEATGKVKYYRAELAHTPRLITAQTSTPDAVEKARSELVDLRLKESELATHFENGTMPLKQVRGDIRVVQQYLSHGGGEHVLMASNPLYDELSLSLTRAQADLAPIETQIGRFVASQDVLRQRLHAIEEGSEHLGEVQRQIDTLTAVLTTYRNKLESARIDEELDRSKTSSVGVISPAFASIKPAFPHKSLFGLAGLVLAILVSGAMWVYQLLFRSNVSTPESVERLLAIPVLMTLPNLPNMQHEAAFRWRDPARSLAER